MITELLIRAFVRNRTHTSRPDVRLSYGLLSGFIGIIVNIMLFTIKLVIGISSGSIAVITDALNNLSDSGSSIITVIGFKAGSKPPDSEHPFGHGRLEYIAGLVVAVIIVAAGFNFLKESATRIFKPSQIDADTLTIVFLVGTMFVKVWLFFFYRKIANKIKSKTIHAAAFDSLSDILTTAIVTAAVFISRYTTFPVDGIAGTLVAIFVIAGGIGIIRDTASPLLGETPDKKLVSHLKHELLKCKGIYGVHDIIIHNYGPGNYFATAHAEVMPNASLVEMHDTLESAEAEIGKIMPIHLLLHCDPFVTDDPGVKQWRARMEDEVNSFDRKFKLYDFMFEKSNPPAQIVLRFHLLTPRNYALKPEEITEKLTKKMHKYDPSIKLEIEFINAYI